MATNAPADATGSTPVAAAPESDSVADADVGLLDTDPGEGAQRIPVNMYESDQALVIVAPMPGVRPEDIEIVIDADQLTLRAELRTAAPKHYLIHEWDYGDYERTVPLPPVFRGEVSATLGNGQLAVRVARADDSPISGARVVHPVPAGTTGSDGTESS